MKNFKLMCQEMGVETDLPSCWTHS